VSLLIKALEQAERRHRQATGQAAQTLEAAADDLGGISAGSSRARPAGAARPQAQDDGSRRRRSAPEPPLALAIEPTADGASFADPSSFAGPPSFAAPSPGADPLPFADPLAPPVDSAAHAADAVDPETQPLDAGTTARSSETLDAVQSMPWGREQFAHETATGRAGSLGAERPRIDQIATGWPSIAAPSGQSLTDARHPDPAPLRPVGHDRRNRLILWSIVAAAAAGVAGWFGFQLLAPGGDGFGTPGAHPAFGPQPLPIPLPAIAAVATPADATGTIAAMSAPLPTAPPPATTQAAPSPPVASPPAPMRPGGSDDVAATTGTTERPQQRAKPYVAPLASAGTAPTGPLSGTIADDARTIRPSATAPGIRLLPGTSREESVAAELESGYRALAADDRATATRAYETALSLDRNNADALVGLATLASRGGEPLRAERLLSRALQADPLHPGAHAAAVALRGHADPIAEESQLRNLIAADRSQPSLWHALGNALARQQRWPDAQQAYFNAVAGDPEQPDYTFNLAVSLERLRQPRAALDHYRRALLLAGRRGGGFDLAQARARVATLEQRLDAAAR
jgi:Tfp pilus assembly protein PilF